MDAEAVVAGAAEVVVALVAEAVSEVSVEAAVAEVAPVVAGNAIYPNTYKHKPGSKTRLFYDSIP